MQQWEYIQGSSEHINLQGMGLQGWELCGFFQDVMIFKRPIGPDWKARCEAAELHIRFPCYENYSKWEEIKNKP